MEIFELPVDKLVEANWLEEYEKMINAFWSEVVKINSRFFILNRLIDFPFDVFQPRNPFWKITIDSILESLILLVWKLAYDTDDDTLNLKRFKNSILSHLANDKYREEFRKKLREIRFEKRIKELRTKITFLRHNLIAHMNSNIYENKKSSKNVIRLSEIFDVKISINFLFDLFCLSQKRNMQTLEYLQKDTDIDEILLLIVNKNDMLRMPEKNPELWKITRGKINKHQLKQINYLRLKLGLSILP